MRERFDARLPGVRIEDVLENLPRSALADLVPANVLEALSRLNPDASSEEGLRKAAAAIMDLNEISRVPKKRALLAAALPPVKVRELRDRLVLTDGDVTANLRKLDEEQVAAFIGFFGGTYTPPERRAPHVMQRPVDAEYDLFPYQRAAALRVEGHLNSATDPLPAVLLHMPTGSGKTRTANHIVSQHLYRNEPSLVVWLANTAELLDQAAAEFEASWAQLGNRTTNLVRYWGRAGKMPQIADGMLVAGFSKLSALLSRNARALLDLADHTSLVVVDEAHISAARTYHELISLFRKKPGTKLLGLSATPGRTWNDRVEDSQVADIYRGNKVSLEVAGYSSPVEYLIAEEYLARPTFRLLEVQGGAISSSVPGSELDYSEAAVEEAAADTDYLEAVTRTILELLHSGRERILVFAASVTHAGHIAALLKVQGVSADIVTGETPLATRQGIIRRFKSDDAVSRVIVNFGVLTTGFDVPRVSAAVIARPTMSLVLYSQMVGRAIRGPKARGNKEAEIVTVVNTALPGFGDVAEAFANWEDVW